MADLQEMTTPPPHPPTHPVPIATTVMPSAVQTASAVIDVRNLSKRFKIFPGPWSRLGEWLTRKPHHDDFWALKDISLHVGKGECVGIIGPNGSGKSTLLKLLTRTLEPTSGSFTINGRLLSLLELGTGFNVELTGRENVVHSAELLAFPPGYAARKMEAIESFAELGDFFDRPVKLYSSGMFVRLAFSMFMCFDPEVLIIDEALSVGDVFFQQKCFQQLHRIMESGTTLLFVSHDMGAIRSLCDRILVLSKGECIFSGDPDEGVTRYFAIMGKEQQNPTRAATKGHAMPPHGHVPPSDAASIRAHDILPLAKSRHGERGFEITAASLETMHGQPTWIAEIMEPLKLRVLLKASRDIPEPQVGFQLYDRMGTLIFASGSRQLGHVLKPLAAGEERMIEFVVTCSVQAGPYTLSLAAGEPVEGSPDLGVWHDCHEHLGPLTITWHGQQTAPFYGIANLPLTMRVVED
ncbi:MAG TPA: ABC transporter ATP-binding protein [Phycisphaerae bacterium]|nr:ABC transporter ATP-binding protein [Phycisphaerae bacterium]